MQKVMVKNTKWKTRDFSDFIVYFQYIKNYFHVLDTRSGQELVPSVPAVWNYPAENCVRITPR